MTAAGWLQIALLLAVLTALVAPLGGYLSAVFRGASWGQRRFGRLEHRLVRAIGADPTEEQEWKAYARSIVVFSAAGFLALYVLLRAQAVLPLNPEGFRAGPWDLSFNTAASFVSNTSWQYYGGETTLSYLSQMAGIAVQSFLSAAVGLAVAIALIRGIASRSGRSLGNFWVDLVRSLVWVLLPLSLVAAVLLASQGVIQTLGHYVTFASPNGTTGQLALGPVASQEPIKLISGDGGGFFNVNSAMPFENPNGLTSFVEILLMLAVPAALTSTFGRMVGNRRQGWVLYVVMLAMFAAGTAVLYVAETHGTPAAHAAGVHGVNLEGKDQRFGVSGTALFAAAATAGGDGAVNGAMESLTGLGGAVPMSNMMTGEVIFGAIGSGLYGMLLVVLLAVFLAGLMVGRTPEYLGKKIREREIKLVALATLGVPLLALATTALAIALPAGRQSIAASGAQGFSESLYAYTSQAFNNGSAFAGYTGYVQPDPGNVGADGIAFADLLGGATMLAGRFLPMILALAVAGALAGQRAAPSGAGTLRTDTATFGVLLTGVIVLVSLLTFVPTLFLGPIVQSLTTQLF
jgi:K+-transporting ATPase ATPase A chain